MLFSLLAADAEEAAEASNPILPWTNELFWGGLSFAALFLLVNYVLLPPVQRARNDRAATIRADKDAAESARSKAASATAEVDDQLVGVRTEASTIIDEARAEAEAERQRLVARAEREVDAMKEIAEGEIGREREEAMEALRPQVADLAVGAASRVMNRQIDAAAARPVVDRFLNNPN